MENTEELKKTIYLTFVVVAFSTCIYLYTYYWLFFKINPFLYLNIDSLISYTSLSISSAIILILFASSIESAWPSNIYRHINNHPRLTNLFFIISILFGSYSVYSFTQETDNRTFLIITAAILILSSYILCGNQILTNIFQDRTLRFFLALQILFFPFISSVSAINNAHEILHDKSNNFISIYFTNADIMKNYSYIGKLGDSIFVLRKKGNGYIEIKEQSTFKLVFTNDKM